MVPRKCEFLRFRLFGLTRRRKRFFVSEEINLQEKGIFMKKINITDITLKELSKNREVSLLFREKTAVASCADSIGIDAIELAGIKNAREDKIIYKTISQNVKDSIVAVPVGFSKEDVALSWECIKEASLPRLQVEVPVSTVQMEYIYHIKEDKMLEKIAELTKEAKALCSDVEFYALDATRADIAFLVAAAKEAKANGATIISISDDAGIALPSEIGEIVSAIKKDVDLPLYVNVSDALGMASASAMEAIKNGADGIKSAMAGGKVLSSGMISDIVSARGDALGIATALKNTKIHRSISDLLQTINHDTYASENKVSEKKKILLDSESTIAQVSQAAEVLGYDLSDEDSGNVLKAIVNVCEKKGTIGAKELEALIASEAQRVPSTYHLESYTTTCGNKMDSMSQVTLKCGDEIISGVSSGDGPIDSVFRAIEQSIGFHYELDDFQIQAVTEGKEALGSAIVKLRNNGKLYSGNGISADIVAASVRAYINALNKIVFEEA